MLRNLLFIVAFGIILFPAANAQKVQTNSGLEYILISEGVEEIPTVNRLMIRYVFKNSADSIYYDNRAQKRPRFSRKSSLAGKEGMLDEILFDLKEGDSIRARMAVSKMFENVPDGVDPGEIWTVNMKVIGAMDDNEYLAYRNQEIVDLRPDDDKDGQKQLARDLKKIKRYLKKRGIEAQTTASGLHYVVHKKGEGNLVKKGDTIAANYTGYLLSNGFHFDTSIEATARKQNLYNPKRTYAPFKTVIGDHKVIDGWDEAFQLFNKGTKATIYLPSIIAYGPRELSENIPANSVMIFEVELLDIIRQ